MKMSHKLFVLVAVPLLAFISVSFFYAKTAVDEATVVSDMSLNTDLFVAVSDLIHEVQKERGRTSIFLSGGNREDMETQRKSTDQKTPAVAMALKQAALSDGIKTNVSEAISEIDKVRTLANQKVAVSTVVVAYGKVISSLMATESAVGNSKTTRGFGKVLTTIIILETAKENAGKLRATVSGILTANAPITEDVFISLVTFKANIDANLDSQAMALSPQVKSQLDEYRRSRHWVEAGQIVATVLSKSKEGNFGVSGKEFFELMTKVIDDLGNVRTNEIGVVSRKLSDIKREIDSSLLFVYCAIGIILAIVLATAIPTARSISRQIVQLVNFAGKVSSGNLTVRLFKKYSPELERLKISLNSMVDSLNGKIKEAEESSATAAEQTEKALVAMQEAEVARQQAERAKAEGMLQAAQQLEGVVEIVSSASEQLSAQVEQSTRGAVIQSDRVAETATAMEEMNATVLEVARNASQAAGTADQAKHKAQDGAQVVTQVVKGIGEVQTSALELKTDMTSLGKQAEEIGQILNVISDIADQTNLLALNAAIEAARAGDAGRGFAVVADEVRKLAEKTMTATKQVGEAIRGIQDGARKNIDNVEHAVLKIDLATSLANESGVALNEIVNLVDLTTDQVRSIATASEEQSATSEEINRSIEDVNRISSETSDGMRQSAQAVAELAHQSQVLKNLIDQMKEEGGASTSSPRPLGLGGRKSLALK